jgi:hypothetical protein
MKGDTMARAVSILDDEQIPERRPLWMALSSLWLDTELSTEDLERIARIMANTDLTIEQLHEIYCVEVAPVVWPNMLAVAGVWNGFDEEWLCSQIIRNLRKRPRRTRFWSSFRPTQRVMLYGTDQYWTRLVELVRKYREEERTG